MRCATDKAYYALAGRHIAELRLALRPNQEKETLIVTKKLLRWRGI